MKVIKYDSNNKAGILAEALVTLLSGGTVVYPTETAYALGGDFYSPRAYRSVFRIKYRTTTKPLPVIVPDFRYAATLVEFSPEAARLAERYWPGPLTLVLPFKYRQAWPHHPDDHLALRVSSHAIAANLSKVFGHPLIATSANRSGSDPCYTIEEVVEQMQQSRLQPDLVIDAGALQEVPVSTIVRVDGSVCTVLRRGSIVI
ncbi:MAG: threonylcarbamoyl-AMP synthase [Candidatus Komeilibacteria bacterium]|nr:threonylcarbamoyl-AMP synthase [Candidatus Komeilibacteria bacterium]